MANGTRKRILDKALELCNEKGFSATSLNELAIALQMTRGNLTYHFPTKDNLLEAIANRMWEGIENERSKSRKFPSFENLHNEVQLYYEFQQRYAFIFLDSHVLRHSVVRDRFRRMTAQSVRDFKAGIGFSVRIGNMRPESIPGTYNHIAFLTWMISFFWLAQQIIRGEKSREDGEKMIWSILLPHFTERGVSAFCEFFGESYLHDLGEPFVINEESSIDF